MSTARAIVARRLDRGDLNLTAAEVRAASKRGIFTITRETDRGYVVKCLRLQRVGPPILLSESKECVRPSTARRYGTELVRAQLAGRAGLRGCAS